MAIHFKFKSAKEFNSINIDGHFITVANLRDRIIEEKNLGKGLDFDLLVVDAHSGEEYKDDSYQVPRNSSVILIRVPATRTKTSIQVQEDSKTTSVNYESSYVDKSVDTSNVYSQPPAETYPSTADGFDDFGDFYSTSPPTNSNMTVPTTATVAAAAATTTTIPNQNYNPMLNHMMNPMLNPMITPMEEEEQRINAMLDKTAFDWQRPFTEPMGGRGRGGYGRGGRNLVPPVGYICHRCGLPGHFIQYCPTNGDPRYDIKRVKPPSGIPRTKLRQDETGSYILPDGSVAVMQPDESVFQKVAETLPSVRISISEPPSELRCPLCNNIFKDAVMIPCCHFSFCDQCIRQSLIAGGKCPQCSSSKYKNDDLLPNMSLRQAIEKFKESQVNSSSAEENLTKSQDMAPIAASAVAGKLVTTTHSKPEISDNQSTGSGNKQKNLKKGENLNQMKVMAESSLTHDVEFAEKGQEKEKEKGDEEEEEVEEGSVEKGKDENLENELSAENDLNTEESKEKDKDKLNVKKKKKKVKTQPAEIIPEPVPMRQKKGDRKCFQCGSVDHMIRECPDAPFNQNMFHQGMFPPMGSGFPPYMGGNFWGGPFGPVQAYPNSFLPPPMNMYGYGDPMAMTMSMAPFEGHMMQSGPYNPNLNMNLNPNLNPNLKPTLNPMMYPGGHPNLMTGNYMGGQDGLVGNRPMLPPQTKEEELDDVAQKRQNILDKRKFPGGNQDRLNDGSENRSISGNDHRQSRREESEVLSRSHGRSSSQKEESQKTTFSPPARDKKTMDEDQDHPDRRFEKRYHDDIHDHDHDHRDHRHPSAEKTYKQYKDRRYEGKEREHEYRDEDYYEGEGGRRERREGRGYEEEEDKDKDKHHRHQSKSSDKYYAKDKYDRSYKHKRDYNDDEYSEKYERRKHGEKRSERDGERERERDRYEYDVGGVKTDKNDAYDDVEKKEREKEKEKSRGKGKGYGDRDRDAYFDKAKNYYDAMDMKRYEHNDAQTEMHNVGGMQLKRKSNEMYHKEEEAPYQQVHGEEREAMASFSQKKGRKEYEKKGVEMESDDAAKNSKESESLKLERVEKVDRSERSIFDSSIGGEEGMNSSFIGSAGEDGLKKRKSKSREERDKERGKKHHENYEKESKSKKKSSKSEERNRSGEDKHKSRKVKHEVDTALEDVGI